MGLILLGGLLSLGSIPREVFPEVSSDLISVSVEYPGAAPAEIEEAICGRIEERLQGLESVKRLRSLASENIGTVTVELLLGSDVRRALDDVKARVDAIDSFPAEAERPTVRELVPRRQVLSVAISGPADELALKRLAEQVRDQIAGLDGITQVEIAASRPYEISIEVSEQALRRHGLTLERIAAAVRDSSLDLGAGSVKPRTGEILLRTEGQALRGQEFEDLVLLTRPDGTRLLLGDVADVVDGFAATDQAARFDGHPAVLVQVFRVGGQDVTEIADRVRDYVRKARPSLPDGIQLTIWQDMTRVLRGRLATLLENGRAGAMLVLLVLAAFLHPRLAGWVFLGIPVSFLGTLWVMPLLGLTINTISIFAFILVLGIVVDDAIVVGENIYRHHEMGKEGLEAALDGLREVAVPVVFSVLTTIAAFTPLLTMQGPTGKTVRILPLIVIVTLLFSLVESMLVLPTHLSHLQRPDRRRPGAGSDDAQRPALPRTTAWQRLQTRFSHLLGRLASGVYRPTLRYALTWRYTTLAICLLLLLWTVGFIGGGHLRFVFLPPVEADNLVAFLTMPRGTPVEVTTEALERLERSARQLQAELVETGEEHVFRHILTSIGDQPFRTAADPTTVATFDSGAHLGEVNIELAPAEQRRIRASELSRRWRELTGSIPDAVELSFDSSLLSAGKALDIQLAGPDLEDLRQAADRLKVALRHYSGVFEVSDSLRAGKRQMTLGVTPEAEALGLTLTDLAHQVRHAFYGTEAQRIQRGREEVRVMLRYPQSERRSLGNLEDMRIRTPRGDAIPFAVAGRIEPGRGFASIERTDRKRTVRVTAAVDPDQAPRAIVADLEQKVLPELVADYPGLQYSIEGEQKEQGEAFAGLGRSFLVALFIIYALLAIPFRSYLQPLIVMSAIPFGVVGAVWGHALTGTDLTIFSLWGMVAVTGVVVNDSLVVVDFTNRECARGTPILEAARRAGEVRMRPILLTSITTFAGLLPLLLERALQAQFLIPMATSVAFGVLFGTAIILFLVPVSYHILHDVKTAIARLFLSAKAVL